MYPWCFLFNTFCYTGFGIRNFFSLLWICYTVRAVAVMRTAANWRKYEAWDERKRFWGCVGWPCRLLWLCQSGWLSVRFMRHLLRWAWCILFMLGVPSLHVGNSTGNAACGSHCYDSFWSIGDSFTELACVNLFVILASGKISVCPVSRTDETYVGFWWENSPYSTRSILCTGTISIVM